jgi:hypothetical protein
MWVPKTIATWADSRETPPLGARAKWPVGRSAPGCACDDLRLVGLKLIFLVVTRAVWLLGLSRREVWWKDAEILILRHQLAVALREQPRAHARLTWPGPDLEPAPPDDRAARVRGLLQARTGRTAP